MSTTESVYADVPSWEAGISVNANGSTYKGPFWVVRDKDQSFTVYFTDSSAARDLCERLHVEYLALSESGHQAPDDLYAYEQI